MVVQSDVVGPESGVVGPVVVGPESGVVVEPGAVGPESGPEPVAAASGMAGGAAGWSRAPDRSPAPTEAIGRRPSHRARVARARGRGAPARQAPCGRRARRSGVVERVPGLAAETEETRRSRWPSVARAAAWVTAVVGVIVVMGVFVFPTRTWLQQRHQLAQTVQEVRILDQQNAALAAEASKLQTDAEVEQLARERYQLVRPGDQVFAIGPSPTPATTVPPATPHPSGGVWHTLTSWIP